MLDPIFCKISAAAASATAGAIKRTVTRLLTGRDVTALSLKALRKEVEERLGIAEGSLTNRKDEVKAAAQAYMEEHPPNAAKAPQASGDGRANAQIPSVSDSKRVTAQNVQMEESKKRPAEEEAADAPKKKKNKASGKGGKTIINN